MLDYISPYVHELAKKLIALTEKGMPLVSDPWGWIGSQLDISAEEVLTLLQTLQKEGIIRRIAAVPNHYALGYRFNGMTVWNVHDDKVDELGEMIGQLPFVSHCYRRPRKGEWKYNLFAMVHGTSQVEIEEKQAIIRGLLGSACVADMMLVSSKILKKTGLRLYQK
ncbi:siroheme decarboxylase subunit beta [Ignatzschineria sp. LJL83]